MNLVEILEYMGERAAKRSEVAPSFTATCRAAKIIVALDDACINAGFTLDEDNPKESIDKLISWHMQKN